MMPQLGGPVAPTVPCSLQYYCSAVRLYALSDAWRGNPCRISSTQPYSSTACQPDWYRGQQAVLQHPARPCPFTSSAAPLDGTFAGNGTAAMPPLTCAI